MQSTACRALTRLPLRAYTAAALALLTLCFAPCALSAQTFDATNLREPTDLDIAHWLVHAGDDPAYASPDFDDSHWTPVDPRTSLKTVFPNSRPEIVWYRLRLKVPPDQAGLALEVSHLSLAFEVYVNGQRIIQSGQVAPFVAFTATARLMQRIPDSQVASGSLLLALRVHLAPIVWDSLHPGISVGSLTLGQENALREHVWLKVIGSNLFSWINSFAGLGLGLVALALFVSERRQWEYLWIFLQFFVSALQLPLNSYELFHNVPTSWDTANSAFGLVSLLFTVLMYFAFLRIPFGRWIQVLLVLVALGYGFALIGITHGTLGLIGAYIALMPLILLLAGVIPVLLVIHFRRGNREAGILLIPVILSSLDLYIEVLLSFLGSVHAFAPMAARWEEILGNLHAGPITFQIGNLSDLLYALSLAIIIVLRSTRMSRQQAFIESEMAAAREVQQIILPEPIERVPGFSIESAYAPAQEVGGDFFQIIPAPEGSLLVVIGDVAGKGLPAAMLVSVLVGAIRGVAEYTSEPAELLANLNQRLVGRVSGAFSTALAARIFPDGTIVMANAGHLAPYLDGHEVPVPGALPLGAMAGTRYETVRAQLPRGSRLTFYSDGVVEATNPKGELLGFDRSQLLSLDPVSQIVDAAQKFGQNDDITVIAITRDAAAARETVKAQTIPVVSPALAH